MDEPLDVRLLGEFQVRVGETLADVGGSKRRGLLAMLALEGGRVVDLDTLVGGLWGEALPAAPRNAIHHHVARLRAAVGEDAIRSTADGYALEAAAVDALRFDELLAHTRSALRDGDLRSAADAARAALDLWRGEALQGLPGTEWFEARGRRLRNSHVDALEERFDVALALGEHLELVPALRAALAEHPFRERLWGQLMLALYRSGRQADALETFQEARRVLADELGVEPGPDLRRLHEAVLAHDPLIAASVRAPAGNLPAASTTFVGREDETVRLAARLREHRLVTLVGPPGVGKSRLALETVRSLQDGYPEGVWLVDLARTADGVDAVQVLADALEVRGHDPLARAISRLRFRSALVVLDGCEHALGEAARIAHELLQGCPEVRILAASRQPLGRAGEVQVVVPPLGRAGVELFLQRASAARPGFQAEGSDLALVGTIVRRLDGLPLAIELAAARVNVLGLADIVSALTSRTALLEDLPADDPARASLDSLVRWSYDELEDHEKALLHHLAVHRGGAALPSLVAAGRTHGLSEPAVVSVLTGLVGRSVVSVSFPAGAARYEMLAAVREYVLERLAGSDELAQARRAHAEHVASVADEAGAELRQSGWLKAVHRLELEHDNLWAALAYARDAEAYGVVSRLGVGLALYFSIAGRVAEGRIFLDAALESAGDAPVEMRSQLLAYLCYLATEEDDLDAAVEAGERGLALAAAAHHPPRETALAKLALAFAYDRTGPSERAVVLAREARVGFDALDDRWGAGSSAIAGALGALASGDLDSATRLTDEAVRLSAGYGVGGVHAALLEASLAERRGDPVAAEAAYRRALQQSESAGFADQASFALAGLAAVRFSLGDRSEATALLQRAVGVAADVPAPWLLAHANARLAHLLRATGDAAGAASLYRQVIEWSQAPRRREVREAFFIALVGSPASAALVGLAELDEAAAGVPSVQEAGQLGGLTLP
jgi:predicted ATPase/DNA-binding SARP family transcriptional activator